MNTKSSKTKFIKNMTDKEKEKVKNTRIRIAEDLLSNLQNRSQKLGMSMNSYIGFLINSAIQKQEVPIEEKIGKLEKKEVESRALFTISEAELLREYAKINKWSTSKEVRYRTVSTLALMPKLNAEEFRAIYSVRSSINILGTNINRLIRKDQVIGDHNIDVCKELIGLISELKDKIIHLEKCSYSHFKLKSLECKKTESY